MRCARFKYFKIVVPSLNLLHYCILLRSKIQRPQKNVPHKTSLIHAILTFHKKKYHNKMSLNKNLYKKIGKTWKENYVRKFGIFYIIICVMMLCAMCVLRYLCLYSLYHMSEEKIKESEYKWHLQFLTKNAFTFFEKVYGYFFKIPMKKYFIICADKKLRLHASDSWMIWKPSGIVYKMNGWGEILIFSNIILLCCPLKKKNVVRSRSWV